jgi:cleavage and polyadenylation specificity factor subunit 1
VEARSNCLRLLGYSKTDKEAQGGQRLLPRAAIHLGTAVATMTRVALPRAGEAAARADALALDAGAPAPSRLGLLLSGLDGSVSVLCPLSPAATRRLALLQEKLVRALPHAGALHPRGFRSYRTGARCASELSTILDAELLHAYALLPLGAQQRMARQVGTTREAVLDALHEIGQSTASLF